MKKITLTFVVITFFAISSVFAQHPGVLMGKYEPHSKLRMLEGHISTKYFIKEKMGEVHHNDLIDRVDNIHKKGYLRWINTAWATMLIEQGLVKKENAQDVARILVKNWKTASADGKDGNFYSPYSAEVNIISEQLGKTVGGNITLGRTNPSNQQTMLVRHYLIKEMCVIHDLQEALLDAAEKNKMAVMPGYTHLMHAQPTTFGHYILSIHDAIARSMSIVEESYNLMNISELGCGALAGTSWDIDRNSTASYLGMDGIIENSTDAVGYADGFLVVVAGISNVMNALSRFALDLNYWTTQEFGFVEMAYHGGSYMMPQKNRNQVYLERLRIGAAKTLGYLTDVSANAMRVPQGDMVEMLHMQDGPMFALDAVHEYIRPFIVQVKQMKVNKERMLEVAKEGYSCASELSNQMVRDYGMDYRTAHDIAHNFVVESRKQGIPAYKSKADMLDEEAVKLTGEKLNMTDKRLHELLDPVHFVKVTNSQGGVAPEEVQRMINVRRKDLAAARQRQFARVNKLENAQKVMIEHLEKIANSN
jgi:argininosuccinate lyase